MRRGQGEPRTLWCHLKAAQCRRNASFEQKAAAVETVTAIREKDGTWHVGGYFIK